MINTKVGFLFPAFAMEFAGSHSPYQDEVDKYLSRASDVVPVDLKLFGEMAAGVSGNELQAHYFCYINSCVVSTILKKQNIYSDYAAGYSMGLFAALFHSKAVSFEDGLVLMHNIYNVALDSIDDKRYGMGVIVGLTYDNVERLIRSNCDNVDIIDISNENVIHVTGTHDEVVNLLEIASKQALFTRMLPITLPYHSRFMNKAHDKISKYLDEFNIGSPEYKIVSCVNQKILTTAQDIQDELLENVGHNINWYKTMLKMLELGVNVFVECGMSKSLSRLAKFIDGNYRIYNITNLSQMPVNNN